MSPLLVSGALKTFFVGMFPYDGWVLPPEPAGYSLVSGRLMADVRVPHLTVTVHHDLAASTGSSAFVSTGAAGEASQAVDLSWVAWDQDLVVRGRIDRLSVAGEAGPARLTLGRQAVSFGNGEMFTPLDLVNPFTPATIDAEYTPGVDAARLDVYPGAMTRVTVVSAYAGDWSLDGTVTAAWAQGTVGVTDLAGFGGLVRGDGVIGASVVTSVGPVGLHGDAALTLPDGGEDPFVRAVAGGMLRPGPTTMVSAEAYLQTVGTADPALYTEKAASERWTSGELWLYGVAYAGAAVRQEVTPVLHVSLATVANLTDPSLFLAPGVSWLVAEEVDVVAGGYVGIGERPVLEAPLPSEFGTWPAVAYVATKAAF